ncbi:MAG: hypothetical protein KC619_13135 [Myxococcales bacterium]|nr:hypothetical protein [Myxococcales bacterium]
MSLVDQFESVFRGAERERYRYQRPEVRRVAVVCDLEGAAAEAFLANVRGFLAEVADAEHRLFTRGDYGDVDSLRAVIDGYAPDLVVAYRNLCHDSWRWPYSLGVYLNVLTRETSYPVVVLPSPHELPDMAWKSAVTDRVMVLTDHLTGDDRLVNWGARFIRPKGQLFLAHVEDDQVLERYIDVIGKIPELDTELARTAIRERLLSEPAEYVASCRDELAAQGHLTHEVVPVITMGHRLADYVALIEEHEVDLLIFNTKEQDQLALHGKAYSLAVRLRDVPILML